MSTPDRPLRVAITGASGLIGQALTADLEAAGHRVLPVVRREPKAGQIGWKPSEGQIDASGFEGLDAVINLAGEPIAGLRWTEDKKRRILESREQGTKLLAEALAGLEQPPAVLISASAIGYYGSAPSGTVDEQSPPGDDFLARVCVAWEAAAEPARAAGLRVVHPRIGVVLAADGGALGPMLPAFKAGLGGRIGSGEQVMSWVSLTDLVGIFRAILADEALVGPVNAVAPNPVKQKDFADTLGRVLGRPTVLPLPSFAVKLAMGELGEALVLSGADVRSVALAEHHFEHPSLEEALKAELQGG